MVECRHEAYREATVRCFALVRTIGTGEVQAILAPTREVITYRDELLRRRP